MDLEVPYLSFSGGEPMLHPHFFDMVAVRLRARRPAQGRDQRPLPRRPENCARLKDARREGGAGEPRRRLARDLQPHARARGVRPRRSKACATCAPPACRSRSTTRPRTSTSTRSAPAVDLAAELGAYSFYTGRTMYTGNAVKAWHRLAPSARSSTRRFSRRCTPRPRSTAAACASTSTRRGCSRSCATACTSPAALLIVLPNGLVKLINALPFVCGDLRRQTLARDLGATSSARGRIRASRNSSTTSRAIRGKTRTLHQWVYL